MINCTQRNKKPARLIKNILFNSECNPKYRRNATATMRCNAHALLKICSNNNKQSVGKRNGVMYVCMCMWMQQFNCHIAITS